MRFEIELPWPLSVNAIWRSVAVGGRAPRNIKSRAYREWRERAVSVVSGVWRAEPYAGPVSVTLRLYAPSRRSYDIDNKVKGVLDALQGVVLEDDDQVDRLLVLRGDVVKGGAAVVTVEAMDADPEEYPR